MDSARRFFSLVQFSLSFSKLQNSEILRHMEGISVGIPRLNRAGIIIDIEEVAHPYHARSRRLWGGELDFLSGHAHFGAPSVRSIFNGELPVAVPGVTAVIGVFVKGIAGAVEGRDERKNRSSRRRYRAENLQ